MQSLLGTFCCMYMGAHLESFHPKICCHINDFNYQYENTTIYKKQKKSNHNIKKLRMLTIYIAKFTKNLTTRLPNFHDFSKKCKQLFFIISFINHCSKENDKKLDALGTSKQYKEFHDSITKQAASSPSFQFPNVQLKSTLPVPLH